MLAPFPSANSVPAPSIGGAAKSSFTSTKLADGRLVVIGGVESSVSRKDVDVYAADGLSRVAGGNLVGIGRQYAASTVLGDGRALVVGGHDPYVSNLSLDLVETMDPTSLVWTAHSALPNIVNYHALVTLHDGNALSTGGHTTANVVWDTVYEYVQTSNTWMTRAPMHVTRYSHTATVLRDGRVLVAGGYTTGGWHHSAEIYDPIANTWTYVAPMHFVRGAALAVLLQDGRVLVAGGDGTDGVPTDTAEVYNPTTNVWTLTPRMANTREEYPNSPGGCLQVLPSGLVLCAGGYNVDYSTTNLVEVYDPQQNIWRVIGTMKDARAEFGSMVTSTGRVLCVAGWGGAEYLATAEFIF